MFCSFIIFEYSALVSHASMTDIEIVPKSLKCCRIVDILVDTRLMHQIHIWLMGQCTLHHAGIKVTLVALQV